MTCLAVPPQVTVRFVPDSLADFDDAFAVDTAGLRFPVPLRARRPPPSLTLEEDLYVGEVGRGVGGLRSRVALHPPPVGACEALEARRTVAAWTQ